jgi:C_GCAxxG_C_C family probable redox protein
MNKIERTNELFMNGGLNCTQAILTVYGDSHGIDPDTARVLGRPFSGGVGASGQICGFVTGAVQVLAHAFNHPDEHRARKGTHPKVIAFLKAFRDKHGAVTCNELLGVERCTEEGEKRLKEEDLVKKKCPAFGRDAAEILEGLLRAE